MGELLLALTVITYAAGVALRRRIAVPLFNPTLTAIAVVGIVILATGTSYGGYRLATAPLSALLTPAVVALAVPLHRHRETLRRYARIVSFAALAGAVSAAGFGYVAARLLSLPSAWSLAATSRSATSPIAIALAGELHGRPALSAVLSIATGVVGATVGPVWLSALRVRHPVARGIAHGIASHGVGTARMVEESHLAGAASALGMALGGTIVAIGLPLLWR